MQEKKLNYFKDVTNNVIPSVIEEQVMSVVNFTIQKSDRNSPHDGREYVEESSVIKLSCVSCKFLTFMILKL